MQPAAHPPFSLTKVDISPKTIQAIAESNEGFRRFAQDNQWIKDEAPVQHAGDNEKAP